MKSAIEAAREAVHAKLCTLTKPQIDLFHKGRPEGVFSLTWEDIPMVEALIDRTVARNKRFAEQEDSK